MSKIIPIAVRTKNRPVYLDVTLKSIWASNLPDGLAPIIIDDCSNEPEAIKYLNTDDEFELAEPCTWIGDNEKWLGRVGKIANVTKLKGIKSRAEIVRPHRGMGVRGCLFWSIDYMMTRFPEADAIIMIEGDVVFHPEWYNASINAYEQTLHNEAGPNGPTLGLLTAYDRRGKSRKKNAGGFCWRSVSRRKDNRWNCINGIGGVMYVVTREFYENKITLFKKVHPAGSRGGDTMLQGICASAGFSIAATVPSYCQHIGITSIAWPNKGWRHTVNFLKPMSFESFDEEGTAYSEDWK